MLRASCPNCGAPIAFRSVDLPVKVCDHCRSAILRGGDGLKAIGTIAEVPEDVSPLELGTRGRDGARAFELVGRVRWRWAAGGWNEWLALFDNGATGWLGESMGRYMLLRPVEAARVKGDAVRRMEASGTVPLGSQAIIDETVYTVADVKAVTCAGSEGELPFSAPLGLAATSVDLSTADERCASIQNDGGTVSVYAGRYVTLADIAATDLRAFEGWPRPSFAA